MRNDFDDDIPKHRKKSQGSKVKKFGIESKYVVDKDYHGWILHNKKYLEWHKSGRWYKTAKIRDEALSCLSKKELNTSQSWNNMLKNLGIDRKHPYQIFRPIER